MDLTGIEGSATRHERQCGSVFAVSVEVLDRPIYAVAAAADLLRVPVRTLRRWLDGDPYRGRIYAPVIRVEPTGCNDLMWSEFVEAGLLAQYRRKLRVRLFRDQDRRRRAA